MAGIAPLPMKARSPEELRSCRFVLCGRPRQRGGLMAGAQNSLQNAIAIAPAAHAPVPAVCSKGKRWPIPSRVKVRGSLQLEIIGREAPAARVSVNQAPCDQGRSIPGWRERSEASAPHLPPRFLSRFGSNLLRPFFDERNGLRGIGCNGGNCSGWSPAAAGSSGGGG
jgi:hypothetical protein